jgi:hypothetical protein
MFVLYHPAHLEYKIRNYRRLHLFARVFASFALSGGRRAPCNEAPRAIVFRSSGVLSEGSAKRAVVAAPSFPHTAPRAARASPSVLHTLHIHTGGRQDACSQLETRAAGDRIEGQGAPARRVPTLRRCALHPSCAPRPPVLPHTQGVAGPVRACPARTRRRREELRRPIYVAGASGAAQIPTGVPSAVDLSALRATAASCAHSRALASLRCARRREALGCMRGALRRSRRAGGALDQGTHAIAPRACSVHPPCRAARGRAGGGSRVTRGRAVDRRSTRSQDPHRGTALRGSCACARARTIR